MVRGVDRNRETSGSIFAFASKGARVRWNSLRCAAPESSRWRRRCSLGVVVFAGWTIIHCLLSAGAEPSISELIETKEISNPTISPDGRYAAFLVEARSVKTNSVRLSWFVARLTPASGKLREVADGGVPIRASFGPMISPTVIWSPDNGWIYFKARRYGQVQVWRVARRGGEAQQVTRDSADVNSFVLSPDGEKLYYTVGATRRAIEREERREYESGVLLTPTVEVYEPVLYNQRNDDGTRTTQRRGKVGIDTFELLNSERSRVRFMALGQPARDATPPDVARYTRLADASENEWYKLLYGWYLNPGSEFLPATKGPETVFWTRVSSWKPYPGMLYQLVVRRRGSGALIKCAARVCLEQLDHFSPAHWRSRSDEVVWASDSHLGAATLYAWDVGRNKVRTIFSSDAHLGGTAGVERFALMGCPITASTAVCVTSGASSPPELEQIDLDSGVRRVIFDPNKVLRERTFGEVVHMNWKDGWGKRHVGEAILPLDWKRAGRLPLVITGYHCGGFLEGSSGETVSPFVLAESEISVLCSDMDFGLGTRSGYPGRSFGPGGQLVNLAIMLDSWESGVKALKEKGLIDYSRIGVSGLSFGAESVWYALTHSTFITAASVQDPPWMDPFNYFIYGTAVFNQFAFRGMPDPTTPRAEAFYARASAALFANKISAPVLEQDNESEFISGMETYTELNRFKKPYEVYVFPDEYHMWTQPRHVLNIQERTTEWFRFWLQGHEDSDPAKSRQYHRWEKLCDMQRAESPGRPTRCVPTKSLPSQPSNGLRR